MAEKLQNSNFLDYVKTMNSEDFNKLIYIREIYFNASTQIVSNMRINYR